MPRNRPGRRNAPTPADPESLDVEMTALAEIPNHLQAEMAAGLRVAAERMAHDRRTAHVPLSRERREQFLAALAAGYPISVAAQIAGVAERTIYRIRGRDEAFAREWELALEASVDPIESRLAGIALTGAADSMATVRAAETLLRGRSRRYRKDGEQGATVTLRQGETSNSISLRLGTPIPE